MGIIVTCTCGKRFKVKNELAGRRAKCGECGHVLIIPERPAAPTAVGAIIVAEPVSRHFADLANLDIAPATLELVPESVAREHHVLPLHRAGDTLKLAISADAGNDMVRRMQFIVNLEIVPVIARTEDIDTEIARRYGEIRKASVSPPIQVLSPSPGTDPSAKQGFWSKLFGRGSAANVPCMPLDLAAHGATFIFGPYSDEVFAEMTRGAEEGKVQARTRLNKLTHATKRLSSVTLVFAHCIPSREGRGKSEQDLQKWALQLMERSGLTPADFMAWTIEWHGDVADNRVSTKFHRGSCDAANCLDFANALERSFTKNGGSRFYDRRPSAPPPQPKVLSTLVSVSEVERIDQQMGELYLHCPKCNHDERINDVGKLMLSQGNNIFANYRCTRCGTVFDGAKNIRKK